VFLDVLANIHVDTVLYVHSHEKLFIIYTYKDNSTNYSRYVPLKL